MALKNINSKTVILSMSTYISLCQQRAFFSSFLDVEMDESHDKNDTLRQGSDS